MAPGIGSAIKSAGRVFGAIACKTACGKLPKTNSIDAATWNKWTEGLAPPKPTRELHEEPARQLIIFHPNSIISLNPTNASSGPETHNITWTHTPTNVTGLDFGTFFGVNNLLKDVFGDFIQINPSAPADVKQAIDAVEDAVEDGQISYDELKQILGAITGRRQ